MPGRGPAVALLYFGRPPKPPKGPWAPKCARGQLDVFGECHDRSEFGVSADSRAFVFENHAGGCHHSRSNHHMQWQWHRGGALWEEGVPSESWVQNRWWPQASFTVWVAGIGPPTYHADPAITGFRPGAGRLYGWEEGLIMAARHWG